MAVVGKYTLPTITGSHNDFVAYLKYDDFITDVLNQIDNGGGNLRFYSDQGGTTGLPCDVVQFDKVGNSIQVFVKIPNASTGQIIYIGTEGSSQPAPTDPLGRNSVWSDYWLAGHLSTLGDSSGNSNNFVTVGSPTQRSSGILGQDYSFGSSSDYIYTDSVFISSTDTFMQSAYYECTTLLASGVESYIYGIANSNNPWDNFAVVIQGSGTSGRQYIGLFDRNTSGQVDDFVVTIDGITAGDVLHITVQHNAGTGSNVTVIHNGTTYTGTSTRCIKETQGQGLNRLSLNRLMDSSPLGGNIGALDEPRITKDGVTRSQSFLETEYQNQQSVGAWGTMEFIESPDNIIVGDIPVSISPVANLEFNNNYDINGDIPVSVVSNSGLEFNNSYSFVGSSSVQITPDSILEHYKEYSITGNSLVDITPNSALEFNNSYSIEGNSNVQVVNNSSLEFNKNIEFVGGTTIQIDNSASFEFNNSYSLNGSVQLNIVPDSETSYSNGKSINGSSPISIQPSGVFEFNYERRLDGNSQILILPDSEFIKNKNIEFIGNSEISVTPNSSFRFGEENYIDGNVNLDITPNSDLKFNENHEIFGSNNISVSANSEFVFNRNNTINGNVQIDISPEAEFEIQQNYVFDGSSSINISINGVIVPPAGDDIFNGSQVVKMKYNQTIISTINNDITVVKMR